MIDDNGDQFARSSIAIWILTTISAAFLFLRLWCRLRFSRLWWDDYVLTISWLIMLVACSLLTRAMVVGYATHDDQRKFFLFQNTSTSLTTIATSWTKVAFAITLTRIVRNRALTSFLVFTIVTANLILIPGFLSVWIPACGDPRAIFRPERTLCWPLRVLQYLGGTTIVYGGVIDVLLAQVPWFVIRKLQLETREKIGLIVVMSLGALTGGVVILRAFYQFAPTDNSYDFMIFMAIFNFLEPAVTIILQTIPMFRVLFMDIKRGTTNGIRIHSPSTYRDYMKSKSIENRTLSSKVHGNLDQDLELLHVPVGPGGRVVQVSETCDQSSLEHAL